MILDFACLFVGCFLEEGGELVQTTFGQEYG